MKIECTENQRKALIDIVKNTKSNFCPFADDNTKKCATKYVANCDNCFDEEVEWIIKNEC